MRSLRMIRPDDWHIHLRDGEALSVTVPHASRQFRRAIVMPNLRPPVVTVEQALAYRERVMSNVPDGSDFDPLMTLYLTADTSVSTIHEAASSRHVAAVKMYPAGATTNSEFGVKGLDALSPVFEVMQATGLPLLIHGESTEDGIDVFDREARFVEDTLSPLRSRFPELRIVLEHITTQEAASFVSDANEHTAATITAHHLLLNRNAIFDGGIRPHHYCLPVLKREKHRLALLSAATSASPKFFLGTDSAPHLRSRKEAECGCAGVYTAHAAIELYAQAFASVDALDKLEGFASVFGPQFYGLERNTQYVELVEEPCEVPRFFQYDGEELVPYLAGESVRFSKRAV